MTLDDLRELLLVSPTAGAAESALATLTGLSRDGDADATAAGGIHWAGDEAGSVSVDSR